jgi:ABC-type branched-subunit amino acid transport system substrate-binding protein
MRPRRASIVATLCVLVGLSGCTTPAKAPHRTQIALVGTDGNMITGFGDKIVSPSKLTGMSGTAPQSELTQAFRDELMAIDPTISDFGYAAEAYDAVAIVALGTQLAGTTDARVVATYLTGVTTTQGTGTTCPTVAACFDRIAAGQDVAYRGFSVHGGFTAAGEPSTASYGTKHFDATGRIDEAQTEYVTSGDPGQASTRRSPAPADTTGYHGPALKLGVLLPETGGLATTGRTMFAAARLAIHDVNAAGGVLGRPIDAVFADDGTDPATAATEAAKLIDDGVTAIVGPATSGSSLKVIPLARAAGVIVFSPSATSAALTNAPDDGLFFRTAPSDNLQSQAVADVILRTGAQRVFIVARDDSYGTGLEQTVAAALATAGVPAAAIGSAEYPTDPKVDATATYASIARKISDFDPDTVLLIGFAESANVIADLAGDGATFTN